MQTPYESKALCLSYRPSLRLYQFNRFSSSCIDMKLEDGPRAVAEAVPLWGKSE